MKRPEKAKPNTAGELSCTDEYMPLESEFVRTDKIPEQPAKAAPVPPKIRAMEPLTPTEKPTAPPPKEKKKARQKGKKQELSPLPPKGQRSTLPPLPPLEKKPAQIAEPPKAQTPRVPSAPPVIQPPVQAAPIPIAPPVIGVQAVQPVQTAPPIYTAPAPAPEAPAPVAEIPAQQRRAPDPVTPPPILPEKEKKPKKQKEPKAPKEPKKPKKQKEPKVHKKSKPRPKGKGRFVTPLILLSIVIMIILGCVWNINYCKTNFEVDFYQVESLKVTSEIRAVVISDVHLREYGEDNEALVQAVKDLHPDLILSAGDLVTYGCDDYENMLSLCRQLSKIAPMYGIMGNHEDEKTYLENDTELRDKFAKTGMKLLINEKETVHIKGNTVELVGVSGDKDGFEQYGGKEVMESLEENSTCMRICLAHVPILFDQTLQDYPFDLGIAGHTHGGVIRLPVIGGLYSAEEGFLPEYDAGMFDLDNGAELFISRGLGDSGKIPRFNNTPELAVIDIRWY